MKKTSIIKKLLNRETLLYLIFGILATIVSLAVYWCSLKLFIQLEWQGIFHAFNQNKNYDYLDANTISWVAAVLFAFITNKLFVFESKNWDRKVALREFLSFSAARVASYGIDQLLMILLVSVWSIDIWSGDILLHLWDSPLTQRAAEFMESFSFLAKCIVQFVIVVLNYIFSKFFIFRKESSGASKPYDSST